MTIADPEGLLSIELLLCGDGPVDLFSPGEREEVQRQAAHPSNERTASYRKVPLRESTMLALLCWLLVAWRRALNSNCALRETTCRLLRRIRDVADSKEQQRLSLSLRYLVWFAAHGINIDSRASLLDATGGADRPALPPYWPNPSDRLRTNVTEDRQVSFLADRDRLICTDPDTRRRRSGGRPATEQKALNARLKKQGVSLPTARQLRNAKRPLRETELEDDAPPVSRRQQLAHAGLHAYCQQLVVDPRPLLVGLLLQKTLLALDPAKQTLRRCAAMALVDLALESGIPVHDALNVDLRGSHTGPASFNAARGCLTLHLAQGYHRRIFGRIPPQFADVPLGAHCESLLHRLAQANCTTIADAFGTGPLDAFFRHLEDLVGSSGIRPQLKRLDKAWLYVAQNDAGLNPGVMQLLRGDVIGPFRSEANYLSITESFLWSSAHRVHDQFSAMLGRAIPSQRSVGRDDVRIGKLGAPLAELVRQGHAIVETRVDTWASAAMAGWVSALLACRPMSVQPHPNPQLLAFASRNVYFAADKTLRGARRRRGLPVPSSMAATIRASRMP